MALRLVRNHMKLRRPAVRVEDERGNPVSFFQLKEMAELEAPKNTSRTWSPMVKIPISAAAFASIAATLPKGSKAGARPDGKGA
jgi:hypothetical protein